jgi:hypothetical protein
MGLYFGIAIALGLYLVNITKRCNNNIGFY